LNFEEINTVAWSKRYNAFDDFDVRLKAIARETDSEFISKIEAICPNLHCELMIGSQIGYVDGQHWTVSGMQHYGTKLADTAVFKRLTFSE
jgi:hypothetical protein